MEVEREKGTGVVNTEASDEPEATSIITLSDSERELVDGAISSMDECWTTAKGARARGGEQYVKIALPYLDGNLLRLSQVREINDDLLSRVTISTRLKRKIEEARS